MKATDERSWGLPRAAVRDRLPTSAAATASAAAEVFAHLTDL